MSSPFSDEQQALREQAREFLSHHSGSEQVRRAMESESGSDALVWKRIGAELGWTALGIPEAYGGVGMGAVELSLLMEEMGAHLLCAPFFSSVCLAAPAILAGGSQAQKQELLPALAEGRTTATLAYAEPGAAPDPAALRAHFRREPDGSYTLHGVKRYVVDGHTAELVVVAARREGTEGASGIELFLVPGSSPRLERRALPTMDLTRRLAELRLDGVRVPASALLGESESYGGAILAEALDRATVALAAEQVGGAQRCLDLSVAYAKERVQFGRPIGSFQAIKHKCADMMLLVESARSAAWHAAHSAQAGGHELAVAASLAKAWCGDAFFHCAAEAIQIHGGVGFTWEYDPHLYFKRARSSQSLLGEPSYHRERVARSMGL
ncbi:MAG TPA: acyl-CoA dehydrogenase family protein [Myxococcota bacterium]|nr:acyl-CoA dehydrogenase family protein [Myxococcota bacterium]